jgi:hypothetical protein
MTCVWCGGYVPLAEPRGSETFCTGCGKGFREDHDYGFFDYTAEIYIPEEEDK